MHTSLSRNRTAAAAALAVWRSRTLRLSLVLILASPSQLNKLRRTRRGRFAVALSSCRTSRALSVPFVGAIRFPWIQARDLRERFCANLSAFLFLVVVARRCRRSLLGPDSVVSSSMRTIERVLKEPRDSDAYVCALDRPRCTPFHPHSQDETNSPRKERSRGPGSRRASWLFEDRCIGVKTQDRGLFVWAVVRAGAGCVLGRSCQVQDRSGRESRCRGPARCRKRRVAPNHSMCMSFSIWTLERSNVLADVSA